MPSSCSVGDQTQNSVYSRQASYQAGSTSQPPPHFPDLTYFLPCICFVFQAVSCSPGFPQAHKINNFQLLIVLSAPLSTGITGTHTAPAALSQSRNSWGCIIWAVKSVHNGVQPSPHCLQRCSFFFFLTETLHSVIYRFTQLQYI